MSSFIPETLLTGMDNLDLCANKQRFQENQACHLLDQHATSNAKTRGENCTNLTITVFHSYLHNLERYILINKRHSVIFSLEIGTLHGGNVDDLACLQLMSLAFKKQTCINK